MPGCGAKLGSSWAPRLSFGTPAPWSAWAFGETERDRPIAIGQGFSVMLRRNDAAEQWTGFQVTAARPVTFRVSARGGQEQEFTVQPPGGWLGLGSPLAVKLHRTLAGKARYAPTVQYRVEIT